MSIIAVVSLVVGLVGLVAGVYFKIRAGKVSEALADIGRLFTTAAYVIDSIKGEVDGEARCQVTKILKGAGKELESQGLKEAMDESLRKMGLNEKS